VYSEDDEEEEEEPDRPTIPAVLVISADQAEREHGEEEDDAVQPEPPRRKRQKNQPLELVEYSPDELSAVDKEMLNAEITQLEGENQPAMTLTGQRRSGRLYLT
jgi:structural maintenance of chromosome 4